MKRPGVIYDMGNNRYGLAIQKEQSAYFSKVGEVFIHVYTDRLCTIPETKKGKEYTTLKHVSKLKVIGYSD